MKCTKHPMNEAIAVCPSCGRGICEICRVNVINVPHCKECAEWFIFQMATIPRTKPKSLQLPIPRGEPNKNYFIIGCIGSIIMMIGKE